MAQVTEIDVVCAGELVRSDTGSPRSPGERVQRWSMMELVGAASLAVSTEPGMESGTSVLAAAPATAIAVLEHSRSTVDANAQMAEAAALLPVPIVAAPRVKRARTSDPTD